MPKPLTWPDIKAELEKRGLSLSALADSAGVSRQAFAKVKKSKSHPAQSAIAKALNRRPEQIWPDRYPRTRRAA